MLDQPIVSLRSSLHADVTMLASGDEETQLLVPNDDVADDVVSGPRHDEDIDQRPHPTSYSIERIRSYAIVASSIMARKGENTNLKRKLQGE